MDILVDKERMNSIIEFWQKKCASVEKELECSINLRKQIQNDLLKSDRLNDNIEAENAELKAENVRLKSCLQEIKAIVTEPCIDSENCLTCKSNCMNKDILDLITKAEVE